MTNDEAPQRPSRKRRAKSTPHLDLTVQAGESDAAPPTSEPERPVEDAEPTAQEEDRRAPAFDGSPLGEIVKPGRSPSKFSVAFSGLLGGLVGAILMLVATRMGWIEPISSRPIGDESSAGAELSLRLAALEQEAASSRSILDQSVGRLTLAETAIKTTSGTAASALAVAEEAKTEAANSPPSPASVSSGDLSLQDSQIDRLRNTVESLEKLQSEKLAEVDRRLQSTEKAITGLQFDSPSTRERAAALLALVQRIEGAIRTGRPFKAELAAAQSLSDEPGFSAQLDAFAEKGLPSIDVLARDFETVMPAILMALATKSHETSDNAGPIQQLIQGLTQDITVTREGEPDPSGPEAPVIAIRDALKQNDVIQAVDLFTALPAEAQQAGQAWISKAKAVAVAEAVLADFSGEALQILTKRSQP